MPGQPHVLDSTWRLSGATGREGLWHMPKSGQSGALAGAGQTALRNPCLAARGVRPEDYARDQEAAIRNNTYVDPRAGPLMLTEWASTWLQAHVYRAR